MCSLRSTLHYDQEGLHISISMVLFTCMMNDLFEPISVFVCVQKKCVCGSVFLALCVFFGRCVSENVVWGEYRWGR